jgi:tRNA (guanine-N7-)-methyltransferase
VPDPLTPDDFRHPATAPHEPLRTFHPRRVGLGPARQDALRRLFPVLGFSVHDEAAPYPRTRDGLLDAAALFGRTAPLVLEIGPGMGEATVAMAAADPGRDYLAVEAHLPGVANLLKLLDDAGPANVRVGHGDGLDLVRRAIAPGSLDAVHAFFPDPWPKSRHHKRRLVQPAHVALLRSRLVVGGVLHTATDWPDYAEQMRDVLTADPGLANAAGTADGYADRGDRPATAFERKALAEGRTARDLVFRRTR